MLFYYYIIAGERWDVVLKADQTPSSYWMNFEGELDCRHKSVSQRAVLRYLPRTAVTAHPDRNVTPLQHRSSADDSVGVKQRCHMFCLHVFWVPGVLSNGSLVLC